MIISNRIIRKSKIDQFLFALFPPTYFLPLYQVQDIPSCHLFKWSESGLVWVICSRHSDQLLLLLRLWKALYYKRRRRKKVVMDTFVASCFFFQDWERWGLCFFFLLSFSFSFFFFMELYAYLCYEWLWFFGGRLVSNHPIKKYNAFRYP